VQGLDDKSVFRYGSGECQDCGCWYGVSISDSKVVTIDWGVDLMYEAAFNEEEDLPQIGGSIYLHWIPDSVTSFNIAHMKLSGTIDTSLLPSCLLRFHVSDNKFSGEFITKGLPRSIENVDVDVNALFGNLDLTEIPASVRCFFAARNHFCGNLDFTSLPSGLKILSLNGNSFCGDISLQFLPASIEFLTLEDNKFDQETLILSADLPRLHVIRIDPESFFDIHDTAGSKYVKVSASGTKTELKKLIPLYRDSN